MHALRIMLPGNRLGKGWVGGARFPVSRGRPMSLPISDGAAKLSSCSERVIPGQQPITSTIVQLMAIHVRWTYTVAAEILH
jgi:hypothetical protein